MIIISDVILLDDPEGILAFDSADENGFQVNIKGNMISKRMVKAQLHDATYIHYIFTPKNITITLNTDPNDLDCNIIFNGNDLSFDSYFRSTLTRDSRINLMKILKSLETKQAGRELSLVRELPVSNIYQNLIGRYISGKNRDLATQENQLKQNLGISLALRANNHRTRHRRTLLPQKNKEKKN